MTYLRTNPLLKEPLKAEHIKDRLPAGAYTIAAVILVNGNAVSAEIRRISIVLSAGGGATTPVSQRK